MYLDIDKIEIGKVYFDVSYSQNELIVPNIQTLVYVGKDLFPERNGDYYFQTSDCYFRNGPFYKVSDEKKKKDLEFFLAKSDYVECLYTSETLVQLLEEKQLKFRSYFGNG